MHGQSATEFNRQASKSRLLKVLALTGSYMLVEVAAGFYTRSLALLADAGHLLCDVASVLLALLAFWFAARPATLAKTYGYYRSEILSALTNGVLLVIVSLSILYEAYRRLGSPPEIKIGPMMAVAVIGLAVNLISLKLLRAPASGSLNIRAAYLEVFSDLLASCGVILAGAIMMVTGWYLADPLISVVIGLMILPRTWALIRECTNILMEGAPGHIDLASLRQHMLSVEGVVDVHDIHVWTITSGLDAMSGHVTVDQDSPAEAVLSKLTSIVQDRFGLRHTTIQVDKIECKRSGKEPCVD